MKKNVTNIIVILILVVISLTGLSVAIEKQERYECEKWKKESQQYINYYLTSWQQEQCNQYE